MSDPHDPEPSARPLASGAGRAPSRRRSDGAPAPLIPDCCEPGIAARVLLFLNAGAVVAALLRAESFEVGLAALAEIAVVLEPTAIASIVLLCALRRRVNGRPRPIQWFVALALPAGVCAAVCAAVVPLLHPYAGPWFAVAWILARALLAGSMSLILVEYFRLRGLSLSPSLSEARLQALQARIRPHFLFNSLNTVLALMRGDPRRAEQTLENLADLFRVFMRDTRDMVPIGEEVETCRHYLEIEQLRLGERLSVRWDTRGMPGDALVPSLLLQPLVENAVHHGIEPSGEHGEIRVEIRQVGDRVRVEIVNPWNPAWPARKGNQMALSNVRERLLLLYDTGATLWTTAQDGRFRVSLEFPCRKERRRRGVQASIDPDR